MAEDLKNQQHVERRWKTPLLPNQMVKMLAQKVAHSLTDERFLFELFYSSIIKRQNERGKE